jgi:hypothetical protein
MKDKKIPSKTKQSSAARRAAFDVRARNLRLPKEYHWKVLSSLKNDLQAYLTEDESVLIDTIIEQKDFDAYLLLQDMWGLQNVSITPCELLPRMDNIRSKYALACVLKKFQTKGNAELRKEAALEKFRAAEVQCQLFNNVGVTKLLFPETEVDACVLTYAKSFIKKVIGEECPSAISLNRTARHGPGSNLDTHLSGQSNAYFKYSSWPYSVTQGALPYAQRLIAMDQRWLNALDHSYRERYDIPKHFILDQDVFWSKIFNVVAGNVITTVPKDSKTDRTIAIEPAINVMLQLGVDGFIRQRLKRWGVDLDSQIKNQAFARKGSQVDNANSYVTLDLAAASDTISLGVVKALFPPSWYTYLMNLRSPVGTYKDEELFNYEKLSSMGNGYTFVIESLIFASIIFGCVRSMEGKVNPSTDYCVFGDDLIVKRKHSDRVIRNLSNCGFRLNTDKSFVKGTVKESCGTDWVQGLPVRPIFLKDLPKNVTELFSIRNQFQRFMELRFGIKNASVVTTIERWIPKEFLKFRGPFSDYEFDSYLHCDTPTSKYIYGCYGFTRLNISSKTMDKECHDFFLRKLMNNLRPKEKVWDYRRKKAVASKGSSFEPTQRNSLLVTRAKEISRTDFWSDEYSEYNPFVGYSLDYKP